VGVPVSRLELSGRVALILHPLKCEVSRGIEGFGCLRSIYALRLGEWFAMIPRTLGI
jgi:hypothetical protein